MDYEAPIFAPNYSTTVLATKCVLTMYIRFLYGPLVNYNRKKCYSIGPRMRSRQWDKREKKISICSSEKSENRKVVF